MTDTTTPNDGDNVVDFARRTGRTGFSLTPTLTLDPPVIPPPPATRPADPHAAVAGGRRSPLDIVAALPDPGILQPPIAPPAPTGPTPGAVPDTFRSEPAGDMTGPRLGALSLAACLAVAVAALRGTHTVLSTWWETRQARQAETAPLREARLKHQLAMQQIADKGAQQHAKHNKVPSSSEFGRKSLGGRSGSKGGGGSSLFGSSGSGGGRGRSGKSNTGSGSTSGPRGSKSSGLGLGGGTKQNGGSNTRKKTPNSPKTLKTPKQKGPHRTSQGGGAGLKKSRTNSGGKGDSGKDRRSLTDALAKDTSKAAQRRLKRRRKNGLDNPALWRNDTRAPRRGKGKDLAPRDAVKDRKARTQRPDKDTNPKAAKRRKDGPDPTKGDQAMWNNLRKAAARRWKKRQKRGHDSGVKPPIWTTGPRTDTKAKRSTSGPDSATASSKKAGKSHWERVRDYARAKASDGSFFGGTSTNGPTSGTGPTDGRDATSPGQGAGTGGRRSPFANAGQSATTTYTVVSEHIPGSQAKRWEPTAVTAGQAALPRTGPAALDAAPTPHTARPGTTRPKEPIAMPPARPDARIAKAKKQAARAAVTTVGRQMDAQHATEITLDDACDAADQLSTDAFTTHDEASRLAKKARSLRDTWIAFADHLATHHNLIGALFTGAAIRFAESMDLVARMADEMEISSLEAAEKAETAGNELNDAYRPYNTATADAGLTTPSAPIHNQS